MDTMDTMFERKCYQEMIRENIGYEALILDNPNERERLDTFVELMTETCCTGGESIRINRQDKPREVVKSRFLKLDSEHIRYVMDCLDKNTTLVRNIRSYLLSALYNAPVTMDQYYASLVRHDMYGGLQAS